MSDSDIERRAAELHRRAFIVDALGWSYVERPTAIIDGKDQVDRAIEAGMTASNQYLASHWLDDFDAVIHKFWRYYGLVEVKGGKVILAETPDDILQAKEENKLALIMGFQGASPIGNDLAYLTIFHRLGLRIMGIAYDRQNLLGYGCREPHDGGLSAFGLVAVKEANRLGITLDCTHTGIRTSLDVIKASSKPVVFTHSNVRALMDTPRNLNDEQIDAIGECNGVIGISTHSAFVRRDGDAQPTLDDMIDHIDYVVQRIGIDHVGLGTDMVSTETLTEQIQSVTFTRINAPGFHTNFTGEGRFVKGFESIQDFPNLTAALMRRGYADDDILKILGGNWMRIFRETWGS